MSLTWKNQTAKNHHGAVIENDFANRFMLGDLVILSGIVVAAGTSGNVLLGDNATDAEFEEILYASAQQVDDDVVAIPAITGSAAPYKIGFTVVDTKEYFVLVIARKRITHQQNF